MPDICTMRVVRDYTHSSSKSETSNSVSIIILYFLKSEIEHPIPITIGTEITANPLPQHPDEFLHQKQRYFQGLE